MAVGAHRRPHNDSGVGIAAAASTGGAASLIRYVGVGIVERSRQRPPRVLRQARLERVGEERLRQFRPNESGVFGQGPDMAEKPYGDAMAASLSLAFPCQAQ